MVTRTQIVEAAQTFVGLPYNPALPSKGFLIAVAQKLALPFRDVSALRGKARQAIQPGDIVVVRVSTTTATHAIVTAHPKGGLCLVRPDQRSGKIVEHNLDRDRILQAFELSEGLDEPTGNQ